MKQEALKFAKKNGVKMVDLKFIDFPGIWQHTTMPIAQARRGRRSRTAIGFDGTSIRGWQPINASDMLIIPDAATAMIDPFFAHADAVADLQHRRPDHQAAVHAATRATSPHKAEAYLKQTGIADTSYFGPEPEFFVFDDVRFDHEARTALLLRRLASRAAGTRGREEGPNLGYKPRYKEATSRCRRPTRCTTSAPRWCMTLEAVGIEVEVATTRWPPAVSARSTCVQHAW